MENRLLMKQTYQYYFKPHPLLKNYIAHYTVECLDTKHILQVSNKIGAHEKEILALLPDASGCIVVTFKENKVSSFYWSPTTKTVFVQKDAEYVTKRLYVEFLPGGARYFKGLEQVAEPDLQIALSQLNSDMAQQLEELATKEWMIQWTVEVIDHVMLKHFQYQEKQLLTLLPYMKQRKNINSVKELAEMTFYSTRHINRIFHEGLGMNAKTYLRLARINKCIQRMNVEKMELIELSQKFGYYDQAHFNHDFKAVCGVTPMQYQRNMSDFYNELFKF